MIRRNIRLRREYIDKKAKEQQRQILHEKKQKLKNALEQGKAIPTELMNEEEQLRRVLAYNDEEDNLDNVQDDEYRYAGATDPKVVLTTSHSPSANLQQFAKEMRLIFPNCQKLNRGNYQVEQLVATCVSNGVTDLVVLHETRGQPDCMIVSHMPHGPTVSFSLYNIVMRHDLKNLKPMSQAYPHLIFDGLGSKLGKRVTQVLKHMFPVPKSTSKRVVSFTNTDDYISFRHYSYGKESNSNELQLEEQGPRFEMLPFQVKLGTLDMPEADTEWVLRPYMNTAHKKKLLN